MTPKDKGMLRELLHEYGADYLICELTRRALGSTNPAICARHLRALADEIMPKPRASMIGASFLPPRTKGQKPNFIISWEGSEQPPFEITKIGAHD